MFRDRIHLIPRLFSSNEDRRARRTDDRRLNYETFGEVSANRGRGRGRGRGNRGRGGYRQNNNYNSNRNGESYQQATDLVSSGHL